MTQTNLTLAEFKKEMDIMMDYDEWGTTLDAWFECAGQMNKRNMDIPANWEYKSGLSDGTDTESYWYDIFENCTDRNLVIIGNYLFKECKRLKREGKDY